MTRAEKRALKKQIRNDIKEFLKIQAHYFPDLIEDIKKISSFQRIEVEWKRLIVTRYDFRYDCLGL